MEGKHKKPHKEEEVEETGDTSEVTGSHAGWYHPDLDEDDELVGEDRDGGPDHPIRHQPGGKGSSSD